MGAYSYGSATEPWKTVSCPGEHLRDKFAQPNTTMNVGTS